MAWHIIQYVCFSFFSTKGPGGSMSCVIGLPNNSYKLSPLRHGFAFGFVNFKKECTKTNTMGSRNCLPFQSIWFNSRFSWVFLVVFCLQLFVFSPFSFWFLYCLSVENELRLLFGIFKLFLRKRIFKRWPQLISYFCIWNCWKNEINISKLLSL